MRVLFALLLAIPAVAEEYDPTEVLIRLRDQVLAHGVRIPNYICVETIARDYYEPAAQPVPKSCDSILARRKTTTFPLSSASPPPTASASMSRSPKAVKSTPGPARGNSRRARSTS
jgi:hypothetical protein